MQEYLHDTSAGTLFADSENISGEFFLEGLEIRIAITDREVDEIVAAQKILTVIQKGKPQVDYSPEEIEKAKYIYGSFMQAHNHEYAHLYQVLALPSFQLVWATRHNLLRFEAAVMLRYFELGGHYEGAVHSKILQILEADEPILREEFTKQFNEFANPFRMYVKDYQTQYDGISLFYIIESMAHIVSLQLSDTPEIDILNLEVSVEYSAAFKYFDECLGATNVELRWKYLVFVYICYYSCEHFSTEVKDSVNETVSCFLSLCSRGKFYIETLTNLRQRYENYSLLELKDLNQWPLSDKEVAFANQKQLGSIYALFELIDILESQAFPDNVSKKSLTVNELDDFFVASKEKNIDWANKYTLARMIIFPSNFVWLREIHDEVMGLTRTDKEFTYAQEAEFYRFIMSCGHLLQQAHDVFCCQEHGMIDKRPPILRCKNEGSLAFTLEALTSKPAHELFRF